MVKGPCSETYTTVVTIYGKPQDLQDQSLPLSDRQIYTLHRLQERLNGLHELLEYNQCSLAETKR